MPILSRLLTALAVVLAPLPAAIYAQSAVDYSRDVRPILAKRCFPCHGPSKQEAGLRLDKQASILAELDSGETAVVPGKPQASELLARVSAEDEFTRMPPEGKPLTSKQIATLTQWIAGGAKWEQHWAFHPVSIPEIPNVEGSSWTKTPIDAFILNRLKRNGLKPNGPAPKLALLRRLYYDLIGLPPSPEQVEAFLADDSPDAFEKVVDQLLQSDHYGEKWARFWLDVVRFAETNSFERDSRKPHAWRYRDYVIRSFNADKPYNQFVREQLAGDEIADPTPDSIIATGYYRLGLWDDEPADPQLAKYDILDDIVTTTGQVFMGLTVNCARCHNHKIDPIPQTDYYGMVAFFQGITPMAKDGPNITKAIFKSPEEKAEYERAVADLNRRRNDVQIAVRDIEEEFKRKFSMLSLEDLRQPDLADLQYRFYRDTFDRLPAFDDLKPETTAKLDPPYFDIRPATRDTAFGFVFEGQLIVPKDGKYTFEVASDDGSRLVVNGRRLIDNDGIHTTDEPVQKSIDLKAGRVPVRLEYFQNLAAKGLSVQWSGPGFKNRYLSATTADGTPIDDLKSKPLPELMNSVGDTVLGQKRYREYKDLKRQLGQLFREKVPADYALCVTENPNPPQTHVLLRGNPRSKGEPVEPAFPAILTSATPQIAPPPSGVNSSGRRLALADWIVSEDNPLTARVIVNRIWQHHFGRGIVRSPNNFGLLGDAPTHPQLLDWLARDFVAGGWKFKRLHKMIVMSSAWRQSSAPNPVSYEKDPQNNLFWKFDPRRLTAEEIRDSLFVVTGEFNPEMFGPGMYPDIPPEILAGQSRPGAGWGKSSPQEQARRAIYIHVKRSLIEPLLADFDFCDTDTSCAARFSTVQPTQALGLLNGDFMQHRAAKFAQRVQKEAGAGPEHTEAQVKRAILLALQRPAKDSDITRGTALLHNLRDEHGLSHAEALNLYCLLVLNLNEFMYLD